MADPQVEAARAEAERARERLLATVHEIQFRLKPATLAEEALEAVRRRGESAVETVKRRGEEIAEETAEAVRRRPVAASATVAGVGALIGVGLFMRRRGKEKT